MRFRSERREARGDLFNFAQGPREVRNEPFDFAQGPREARGKIRETRIGWGDLPLTFHLLPNRYFVLGTSYFVLRFILLQKPPSPPILCPILLFLFRSKARDRK